MSELSLQCFKQFAEIVYKNSGIHIRPDKKSLLQSRLTKLMRREKIPDYKSLLETLESGREPRLLTEFIDVVSTNVTRFFREIQHFDFIRDRFIPELLKQKNREIRVWSSACSSGQEPYSVLIHLLEHLPEPNSWNIQFLATDISTKVLRFAQAGIYSEEALAEISPSLRDKYFEEIEDGYFRIHEALRQQIRFRHFNLMQPFPFRHKFDLVLCRNVMIYFNSETQKQLVDKFKTCIRKEGYLIVGLSEALSKTDHDLQFVKSSVYQVKR